MIKIRDITIFILIVSTVCISAQNFQHDSTETLDVEKIRLEDQMKAVEAELEAVRIAEKHGETELQRLEALRLADQAKAQATQQTIDRRLSEQMAEMMKSLSEEEAKVKAERELEKQKISQHLQDIEDQRKQREQQMEQERLERQTVLLDLQKQRLAKQAELEANLSQSSPQGSTDKKEDIIQKQESTLDLSQIIENREKNIENNKNLEENDINQIEDLNGNFKAEEDEQRTIKDLQDMMNQLLKDEEEEKLKKQELERKILEEQLLQETYEKEQLKAVRDHQERINQRKESQKEGQEKKEFDQRKQEEVVAEKDLHNNQEELLKTPGSQHNQDNLNQANDKEKQIKSEINEQKVIETEASVKLEEQQNDSTEDDEDDQTSIDQNTAQKKILKDKEIHEDTNHSHDNEDSVKQDSKQQQESNEENLEKQLEESQSSPSSTLSQDYSEIVDEAERVLERLSKELIWPVFVYIRSNKPISAVVFTLILIKLLSQLIKKAFSKSSATCSGVAQKIDIQQEYIADVGEIANQLEALSREIKQLQELKETIAKQKAETVKKTNQKQNEGSSINSADPAGVPSVMTASTPDLDARSTACSNSLSGLQEEFQSLKAFQTQFQKSIIDAQKLILQELHALKVSKKKKTHNSKGNHSNKNNDSVPLNESESHSRRSSFSELSNSVSEPASSYSQQALQQEYSVNETGEQREDDSPQKGYDNANNNNLEVDNQNEAQNKINPSEIDQTSGNVLNQGQINNATQQIPGGVQQQQQAPQQQQAFNPFSRPVPVGNVRGNNSHIPVPLNGRKPGPGQIIPRQINRNNNNTNNNQYQQNNLLNPSQDQVQAQQE